MWKIMYWESLNDLPKFLEAYDKPAKVTFRGRESSLKHSFWSYQYISYLKQDITFTKMFKICKILRFQGGDHEECRLLGYKTQVRTSQETHYVSATESSHLMLSKILGFHGGNYEECRLLGYKPQVRTSQETHYVFATGSSQLMLSKILGFHGGNYEECRLLGYKTQVRTSQKTHYFSATESSQVILCKI
jgi:hypothetical protein